MTKKERTKRLIALAAQMRQDITAQVAMVIEENQENLKKLAAVDAAIVEDIAEMTMDDVIHCRLECQTFSDVLDSAIKPVKSSWKHTQDDIDANINARMNEQGLKTLKTDAATISQVHNRRYKVGDVRTLASYIQEKVVNGEPLEDYLQWWSDTLKVGPVSDYIEENHVPSGVDISTAISLRFTRK
jgi:hypothetical protein